MARSRGNLVFGAAVVLGGVWYLMSRKASAAPAMTSMVTLPTTIVTPPMPVPGNIAPTGSAITAAQAIWQNLTSTTGPYAGFVNFPSGSQAAAAFLPWATDGAGNYYTQWAGQIYLVGVAQPDSSGNYAAKLLGT
jgi:hypothetical protein